MRQLKQKSNLPEVSDSYYRFSILHLLGTVSIALAWLLPNHHKPWLAFHSDAWMAIAMLCVGLFITLQYRSDWRVPPVALAILCLSFFPVLHFYGGLLDFSGEAWINFLYLFALFFAVLLGFRWGRASLMEAVDFVSIAIVFAGFFSVGLQLYQWVGLSHSDSMTDIWVLYLPGHARPYGNLGQPNLLASLFLWSLLGLGWFTMQQRVRLSFALPGFGLLIFGLALTESRMGLLAMSTLVVLFFYWGWRSGRRKISFIALLVYVAYISAFFGVGFFSGLLGFEVITPIVERTQGDLRLPAWSMFLRAALESPWLGYGWGHTSLAQMMVSAAPDRLTGHLFSHAHNIFLDLVLWVGFPAGVVFGLFFVWYVGIRVVLAKEPVQFIVVGMIVTMGIHAMLELPLYYAYFLLPFGIVLGLTESSMPSRTSFSINRRLVALMLVFLSCSLFVTIRDYMRVEDSYNSMRFEMARVGTHHDRSSADVLVLGHLRDMVDLIRYEPVGNVSADEVEHIISVAKIFPSSSNFAKMLIVLSNSGRGDEAEYWAPRYCRIFDERECNAALSLWKANIR